MSRGLSFDLPPEFYSGSDSESRRRRRVVKDKDLKGEPGSRRFRRFLNSILSDYESEPEQSDVEDVSADRVVDFEWSGHFTQVGRDFYDGANVPLGVPRPNRAEREKARARRRRHLQRLKRAESVDGSDGDIADHPSSTPRGTAKSQPSDDKHERKRHSHSGEKQKRVTNVAHASRLLRKKSDVDKSEQEGKHNWIAQREFKEDEEGQQNSDSDSDDSDFLLGQDNAPALYKVVEEKYRKLFKKLADTNFLSELEQVMIGFKLGRLSALDAAQLPTEQFQVLAESGDAEGEEKLTISFHSAFGRLLCHGLAQFHLLIPSDGVASAGHRYKAFLKRPRKGLTTPHRASLCVHLQRLMAVRKARANGRI